jgi:hypothetical protein
MQRVLALFATTTKITISTVNIVVMMVIHTMTRTKITLRGFGRFLAALLEMLFSQDIRMEFVMDLELANALHHSLAMIAVSETVLIIVTIMDSAA